MNPSSSNLSSRQQRHLATIAEHDCSIHHIAGKANLVADELSRSQAISVITSSINYEDIAQEQDHDAVLADNANGSLVLELVRIADSRLALLCDSDLSYHKNGVRLSLRPFIT